MCNDYSDNTNTNGFAKPDNVLAEEWFALDLSDPLMAVC